MEEALLETTIVNAILRVGRIVGAGGAAVRAPDRLLNVTEVAKALGIGKNAANELVQNGIIPGIKLNGMKVRQRVLEDWLESMEGMDLSDPKNPVPLAMGGK
ncbi:helix-turn-helix domain-containing protein [Selenomonas sputigena]|uniref:helix-turn-helix domain-containing protein n=1 Tax=Selenomonas sputigena TaxID=69823 RepID=UPI0028EB36AA|nr:helix-turn-helix domain-containing protein [Selenomonas sputigena]